METSTTAAVPMVVDRTVVMNIAGYASFSFRWATGSSISTEPQ